MGYSDKLVFIYVYICVYEDSYKPTPDSYIYLLYILIILLHNMDSFTTWMLRGLYAKQEKSRLSQISDRIDWSPIRCTLEEMYDNKSERGGRPNCDVSCILRA